MAQLSRVDLHMHTEASDGQWSPAQLVATANERGMELIAITDHDTCESAQWAYGYARHLRESGAPSTRVIPGVELTARIERGGGPQIAHLVALDVDPYEPGLLELCEHTQQVRLREVAHKLEFVASKGLELGFRVQAELAANPFTGRGDIARALIQARQVGSMSAAYREVFDDYDESVTAPEFPDAATVVEVAHAAGGVVVWAHPLREVMFRGDITREECEARLAELLPAGIDALECWYSTFKLVDCRWLEALAKKYNLLVSGGSDHHGGRFRDRMGCLCANAQVGVERLTVLGRCAKGTVTLAH